MAATAFPTWRCCGTSRSCSGRWPRPRPPGGSSSGSPRTPTGWPGCAPPGPMLGPGRGRPAPTRTRAADRGRRRHLGAGPQRSQGRRGGHLQGISFGFHPLLAYLDRGKAPGEPLAGILRPGNAPAGGSDDLIELVVLAHVQLPTTDQSVLVQSDSAGASTRLAWHLRDQRVGFSLGMPIDAHVREAILTQPEQAWTPAIDADGQPRDGAEVCELTGWLDL